VRGRYGDADPDCVPDSVADSVADSVPNKHRPDSLAEPDSLADTGWRDTFADTGWRDTVTDTFADPDCCANTHSNVYAHSDEFARRYDTRGITHADAYAHAHADAQGQRQRDRHGYQ
jgi:hypothetical protein